MKAVAIIPAAGSGTRLAEITKSKSKVLLPLVEEGGRTLSVLELVLRQLVKADCFIGIAISTRAEDIDEVERLLDRCCNGLRTAVVTGGATRQQSVFRALSEVRGWGEIAAVHDAARPFCRPEVVRAVVSAAWQSGGAIVAQAITSTIKEGSLESGVLGTISREDKWLAQTPQAFKISELYAAFDAATQAGVDVTDESQLFERLGQSVAIVPGDPLNIKITTPEDLAFARSIVAQFL